MTRPMPMPIAPPASSPSSHTSMLCAQPAACRAVSAASSGSVSQRGSRPAAFLGHPAERGVGGRPQVVAADHPAHVPAQVDAAHQDHRPRVRRPPGHPVRVPVADHGDRPVRHQVLVPVLVDGAEVLVGRGHRDDRAGTRRARWPGSGRRRTPPASRPDQARQAPGRPSRPGRPDPGRSPATPSPGNARAARRPPATGPRGAVR
jgi:hypothetical protein